MIQNDDKTYFDYLSKRTLLGLLYRRYYLYPRLDIFLRGKVLDIGCGIGDFLAYRKQTVGVDINAYNVEYCRRKGFNARLIENASYPFEDNSFDGAIIDNVLEHLEDPLPTLSEVCRVLVTYGTLIVGIPGWRGFKSDPDHKKFYSEESMVKVLHESNFQVRKILHVPFRSSWLYKNMSQYCMYGIFHSTRTLSL